jgi:hypothetical protein
MVFLGAAPDIIVVAVQIKQWDAHYYSNVSLEECVPALMRSLPPEKTLGCTNQ